MAGGGGGSDELNLVPYLDIMINLIMFMLTVTAYIVELREAPVLAPAYTPGTGGGSDVEKRPFLTVAVTSVSLSIISSKPEEIPAAEYVKEGGSYPYARLTQALREYKTLYELDPNLVLTADATVPYSAVVATMDAARSDDKGALFPSVNLAVSVQ